MFVLWIWFNKLYNTDILTHNPQHKHNTKSKSVYVFGRKLVILLYKVLNVFSYTHFAASEGLY